MGIPSYFSYIIKNHTNIIRKRSHLNNHFSSLYMDCNSIIYDCVRNIESDSEPRQRGFDIEDAIINAVIAKIEKYLNEIQPSNVIYIAFDGVAPYAKMEQQRMRRHKTGYLSEIARKSEKYGVNVKDEFEGCNKLCESSVKDGFEGTQGSRTLSESGCPPLNHVVPCWNTSAITPGTKFMNMLSLRVKRAFVESGRFFGSKTVIVSGSDEPGEGEHKMFQYMRENVLKYETVAVYGLDADLIMLSVFHCFACENIHIFRESPEFGKALLDNAFARDELLYLDNRALAKAILSEMGVHSESKESIGRIYDYVFACFLLGNDFLPHFPALNIRTHGNFTVLETYRNIIARYPERRFISLESGNIQWRWVKEFMQELAKDENKLILNEYESRSKMEKRFYPTTTKEDRSNAFDNIPTIYRGEEHYINPSEKGWESRYYRVAFHSEPNVHKYGVNLCTTDITSACMDVDAQMHQRIRPDATQEFMNQLCNNYLEGLEWTFKYYTEGCPHWRWKYNYHYPPLFVDLVKRVPSFETIFIDNNVGINKPFHPNTQLAYVIPIWNHNLLSNTNGNHLDKKYYVDIQNMEFQWMFCRYFWEAHSLLPNIPIENLEELDANNYNSKSSHKVSKTKTKLKSKVI